MGLIYVVFFSRAFQSYCVSLAMRDDLGKFPEITEYFVDGALARAKCARMNDKLKSSVSLYEESADE